MPENTLYFGDNLQILRENISDELLISSISIRPLTQRPITTFFSDLQRLDQVGQEEIANEALCTVFGY